MFLRGWLRNHTVFLRGWLRCVARLASDGDMGSVMRDHQRKVEKMHRNGVAPAGGAAPAAGGSGGASFKKAGNAVVAMSQPSFGAEKKAAAAGPVSMAPVVVQFTQTGSLGFAFETDAVRDNHEFCIQNKEFCIKNERFCIQNDEFCSWTGCKSRRS